MKRPYPIGRPYTDEKPYPEEVVQDAAVLAESFAVTMSKQFGGQVSFDVMMIAIGLCIGSAAYNTGIPVGQIVDNTRIEAERFYNLVVRNERAVSE